MLEHTLNQAAGLLALTPHAGPQMLAMVSHGDEQAELPLLWRLCLALVDFGYSVTVLDATTCETETNPGLDQMLDDRYWHEDEDLDTPAWTVLPAGRGIQNLCAIPARRQQNLRQLGHLFRHDGVVIVYSPAEWLVPLVGETGIEPLLAMSSMKSSLLTGYVALKRLLINGKLEPTIVNMIQEHRPAKVIASGAMATSLSECAKNFLGYDVKAINIAAPADEEPPCRKIQGLALRLLENAMPLRTGFLTAMPEAGGAHLHTDDPFAGSH